MVEVNIVNNNKKNTDIGYIDVTEEWLANATPNSHKVKDRNYYETIEGIKYYVDNKNVILEYSKKEKETAIWLENIFGGEIFMLPRINKPDGIMTADYLIDNEYWDLKNINGRGKRVIEDAIKKKRNQSNNFIFDITKSKIKKDDLFNQLEKIYKSKTTNWVNKIIVKKGNKVIKCFIKGKKISRNPTGHDQSTRLFNFK